MRTSTVSERGVKRVFNFNAGPGALPLPVLERVREELLDWRGTGMSVMEMSHRSPEFEGITARAEAGLRKHLAIPDDYAVLFLAGRRQHAVHHGADEPVPAGQAGRPAAHRHVDRESARRIEERHSAQRRCLHRGAEIHARAAHERNQALRRILPTSTSAPTTRSKARSGTRCRNRRQRRSSRTCRPTSRRGPST